MRSIMISFCCQRCSREYKVDDKYGGRKARCKQCDTYNVIPVPKAPQQKPAVPDTISFSCDTCGQQLKVKSIHAGKRVKCSSCGQPCLIPNPQAKTKSAKPAHQPSEMVSFNCQMCSGRMQAEKSKAGDVVECPQCQCFVEVPGKAAQPAEEELSFKDWENQPQDDDYMPFDAKPSTLSSSPKPRKEIPPEWKIPAAIGTSIAFTMGGAIVWTVIAALTGFQFSIILVAVGGLAGAGLTLYTDKRSTALGFAAVLIAIFGMAAGKVLVARYAVISVSKSLDNAIIDAGIENLSFTPSNDFAVFISSSLEKRDKGDIPEEMAWPVFRDYLKIEIKKSRGGNLQLQIWEDLANAVKQKDSSASMEQIKDHREDVKNYIQTLPDKEKARIVDSHKAEIVETFQSILDNVEYNLLAAVLRTFGIFDLIWIPVGLATAFNLGSGKNGSFG